MHSQYALKYGDWIIDYYPPPIPTRNHDWNAVHKDYDGPEDGRYFTGPSIEDLKLQIDEYEEDQDERDSMRFCDASEL